MTHAELTCDICGYTNHYAGVASCSMPLSVAWCSICLAMGVEPDPVIMIVAEDEKDLSTCTQFPRFDRETDRYYIGTEHLPVTLKDGRSFDTRGALPDDLA